MVGSLGVRVIGRKPPHIVGALLPLGTEGLFFVLNYTYLFLDLGSNENLTFRLKVVDILEEGIEFQGRIK